MAWREYEAWQAGDPGERPETSLVDGVLAGAVVSLRSYPDDEWLSTIFDRQAFDAEPGSIEADAVGQLRLRMAEIRAGIAGDEDAYTPILTITDQGDFDVTAWSTGFLEAIAPDLETWTYVLAGKREGGLLGLLGSHAVGSMGEAARALIDVDDDREALLAVRDESWAFISQLLVILYRKKLELTLGGMTHS
jgi:hypothetical protein